MALDHTVTMTYDHTVSAITLDTIVASDTIVAFVHSFGCPADVIIHDVA
jgi:hypothetical protein